MPMKSWPKIWGSGKADEEKTRREARERSESKAHKKAEAAARLLAEKIAKNKADAARQAEARLEKVKKLIAKARSAQTKGDYGLCIEAARKAGKLDSGKGDAKKLLKECKEQKDLEGMKF